MDTLKNSKTNWKYILIVVMLAFIISAGILGYKWLIIKKAQIPKVKSQDKAMLKKEKPFKIKPEDSELLVNMANIIKSLLSAKSVYIYSGDIVSGDIDNDKKEELVVFATVVGGTRPTNACGKWDYEGQETSSDLMILSKENGQYIFKAYFIEPFGMTNAPKIYLKDFNGDKRLEIILSTSDLENQFYTSSSKIYKLEKDQLQAVSFKGGELDGSSAIYYGALKLDESKPNQLTILYGEGKGVSDTYIWNEAGFFEFLSSTSRKPTKLHQLVINYLEQNITDIVKQKPRFEGAKFNIEAIQFYPENKILSDFGDGHIGGYFLGQYELENNKIRIEYIDEACDETSLEELRKKYGLVPDKAMNYFRSRQDFKWTPVDLFTFRIEEVYEQEEK